HRRNQVLGLTGNETGGADDNVMATQCLGHLFRFGEITVRGSDAGGGDFFGIARNTCHLVSTLQQLRCNLAANSSAGAYQCYSFAHGVLLSIAVVWRNYSPGFQPEVMG